MSTPWIEYPYPIRDGNAFFVVPRDLTVAEARRIAAFLESVATDAPESTIPSGSTP